MARRISTLILAVILAFAAQLPAQNLIFYQNTQSQAFLFKYGGGGPSASLVDYFIKKISDGSGKQLARTEYVLVHEDAIRLTKVDATRFDVQVSLGAFRLNGDINYRGFELGNVLVPNAVKFRLEHRDKLGKVKQGWDFRDVPLGSDPSIVASFRANDSTANFLTDNVIVAEKQFIYNDASRLGFEARVSLIDGYYRDAPLLETYYLDIQKVNPTQFEQLESQEAELKRIQAKLEPIRKADYPKNLELTASKDPSAFLRKMNEVDVLLAEKQAKIADTRARLHEFYHARGLSSLQANKPALAKADFQKSVQIEPKYAPPHIELARLSYAEGQPAEAVNKLQYVFTDLTMDAPVREKARSLAATIYQNFIANANAAILKGEYEKALLELDQAKNLCTRIPAVPCENALEANYLRAHRGIYTKIVSEGVKLENEKKLVEAEKQGLAALEYQKKQPQYIGEPREANELLRRVRKARFDGLVAEGERLLKLNQLADAERVTREAVVLQATFPTDVPDKAPAIQTLTKIMALRYTESIQTGQAKFAAKAYTEALVSFELAKGMESEYAIKQDTTLGTKIRRTAKEIVMFDGGRGLELAKANRLGEAREISSKFNEMVSRYGLASENAVVSMQKDLQAAIFSQECTNASNEYNNMMATAELLRAQRRYLEADAQWAKAIAHAEKNAACQINFGTAVSLKVEHAQPTQYQSLVAKAKDAEKATNFSGSIDAYNQAGDIFYSANLGAKFGLTHEPLLGFVRASGNQEYFLAAAGHFIDVKSLDQSLELVYELATKNYPKSRLKGIQSRLGKELAIRDKQVDGNADPKIKSATYTRGQKTMAGVAKAYKKQWKAM